MTVPPIATVYVAVAVLLALASTLAYMYFAGGIYVPSRHSACFFDLVQDSFCDIETLDIRVPEAVRESCLELVRDETKGSRVSVPFWKSGRTIPSRALTRSTIEYYSSLERVVSEAVGTSVYTTPLDKPTSVAVLVYEKEGDFINWHYDVNYFKGRFFTLLLPLTTNATCTTFRFMNRDKQQEDVVLEDGTAILFEGEKVFHMATKLCADQERAILSMQFSTDPAFRSLSSLLLHTVKDKAYA